MRTHVRSVVITAALAGVAPAAHAQSLVPEATIADPAPQARRVARAEPTNSAKTSACETSAEPDAARELPPEVAAPFRAGEIRRALGAWNKDRHPTTACVRVYGPPRTSPRLIGTFIGLMPGTRLTNGRLIRARRRLDQLPLAPGTVVTFAPIDDARASVEVMVGDRSVLPAGLVPIATIGVTGLATQEYKFDVASPTGRGEDVFTAVRWQQNWHRVRLGLDLPITGPFAGIVTMGLRWEQQLYMPVPNTAATLERRSVNVGLSSWATSWFWWHAAAGGDQMDGRTYAAAETAADSRFFRDHVSVGGNAAIWQGSVTGGHFGRAVGSVSVRSTTRQDAPVWLVSAGAGTASESSPWQTWVAAGSRTVGDAVLRAHPLVRDGVVRGNAFGRRLAFGSVEYDRPFWRSTAGPVSWTAFVDSARAWRRANGQPPTPWLIDAGVGLHLRAAGLPGEISVEAAHGLRDDNLYVSFAFLHAWQGH